MIHMAGVVKRYGTKIVAIRMMFSPLEFRGIKEPYLGWQGQIPRHAAKMAGIAVDTERGLVVPVIKDADRKSIRDLASVADFIEVKSSK